VSTRGHPARATRSHHAQTALHLTRRSVKSRLPNGAAWAPAVLVHVTTTGWGQACGPPHPRAPFERIRRSGCLDQRGGNELVGQTRAPPKSPRKPAGPKSLPLLTDSTGHRQQGHKRVIAAAPFCDYVDILHSWRRRPCVQTTAPGTRCRGRFCVSTVKSLAVESTRVVYDVVTGTCP
jgi:hypothetical protein